MTLRVHSLSRAGDRPTPVQRFQAIHHPREILRERQVAAGKFFQGPYAVFSVIDRGEKPGPEKVGQLACIDAVTLVARFEQRILPRIADHDLRAMRLHKIVQSGRASSFFKGHLHTAPKSVEKRQNRGCLGLEG